MNFPAKWYKEIGFQTKKEGMLLLDDNKHTLSLNNKNKDIYYWQLMFQLHRNRPSNLVVADQKIFLDSLPFEILTLIFSNLETYILEDIKIISWQIYHVCKNIMSRSLFKVSIWPSDTKFLCAHKKRICKGCRNQFKYKLITKTKAKNEYVLTDDDLSRISFLLFQNPYNSNGFMYLFLEKEVSRLKYSLTRIE